MTLPAGLWLTHLLLTGIEPTGNMVKKRAEFIVETRSAGQGEVLVYVEDPAGHQEEVGLSIEQAGSCYVPPLEGLFLTFFPLQAKVTANNDKNRTFSVWYVPEVTGTHKVSTCLRMWLVVMGGRLLTSPSQPAPPGNR